MPPPDANAPVEPQRATSSCTPVFVVGCYRSGTTLMENVLARHHEFATLSFETHFFTHVLCGKRLPDFNRGHWRDPLTRHFGVADWQDVRRDPLTAYQQLMSSRARERGGRFWVEKTPDHVFAVDRIRRLLPGARFIGMLRDGRDVVPSIVHAPYILPSVTDRARRIVAACAMWEWMTARTLRLAANGASDVLLVRYERLVQSPPGQLRRLSEFLRLDASAPDLSLWLSRLDDIPANSSFGAFSGLDTTPARRNRTDKKLTSEELALAETMIAKTLRSAGYSTSPAAPLPLGPRLSRTQWLTRRFLKTVETHGSPLRHLRQLLRLL